MCKNHNFISIFCSLPLDKAIDILKDDNLNVSTESFVKDIVREYLNSREGIPLEGVQLEQDTDAKKEEEPKKEENPDEEKKEEGKKEFDNFTVGQQNEEDQLCKDKQATYQKTNEEFK
jgi:hypothetical protein